MDAFGFDYYINSIIDGSLSERDVNTTSNPSNEVTILSTNTNSVSTPISNDELNDILAANGFSEGAINNMEVVSCAFDAAEELKEENSCEPLIPENSPTLLIDDSTSRFSGTEWYSEIQKKDVTIIGAGGIGSNTAFQIARLNPRKITIYDGDTVETGNMSGQLFCSADVGRPKVSAITDMIIKYTTVGEIYSVPNNVTLNTKLSDIVICGLDNMAARRHIFNSWVKRLELKPYELRNECVFIDGRLSIDTLQVFCIRGNDLGNIERYKNEFLFTDDAADETVCSLKQTTYMACMIAAFITNIFTNWVASSLNPVVPYNIPFFTEYNSQFMSFKFSGQWQ